MRIVRLFGRALGSILMGRGHQTAGGVWTRAGMSLIVLLCAGPGLASAQGCGAVGQHHLRSGPGQVAFEIRRTGGLFPPAIVTIYGGGRVVGQEVRLADPHLQLGRDALRGLLRLAEAESFFRMPANILCSTRETDLRTISISIRTTTQAKTVSLLSVCKSPRFLELYAVLLAVTGSPPTP